MDKIQIKPVYIAYAAIGVGIVYLLFKTGQKIGVIETKATKAEEKNLSSDWLTPIPYENWKKKTGYKIPSAVENFVISGLVNKIYDAKGFFNDDEDAVYNFFRKLESKMQASATAFYFKKEFGRDLSAYLASFMNAEEIQKVTDIINMKPEKVKKGLITANFGK